MSRQEPSHTPQVAARQILVHEGCLFLIDAAGQLWYADVARAQFEPDPQWKQIELPKS